MLADRTTPPPHWIRRNEASRLPRRWVTIDTEAHRLAHVGGETQTFRLAVTAFDHQTKKGEPWRPTTWGFHRTPGAMWAAVVDCCKPGTTTVMIAHNLAYDLRVAQAFTELPRLGYRCEIVRLDSGATWSQWSGPNGTLKMVDSVSWFGVGLDEVGKMVGVGKLPLPDNDADDQAWFDRCRVDVDILRLAWAAVMEWLEASDMGTWKPTGAGMGWAAYRHRFMDVPVLHHGSSAIAAVEREAAYTGRCEAWRWGDLGPGPHDEWDHRNAYAMIALDSSVPVRLRGHVGPAHCRRWLTTDQDGAVLIRATVTQPFPVLPARGANGILWPVGTVAGWWWDVELQAAIAAGATVDSHEGWQYDTAPALRTWASWVLDTLAAPDSVESRLVALVVKGWSRTLIGKFGSRWSDWADLGSAPVPGVWLGSMVDGDTGQSRRMLTLGDRCQVEGDTHDAPDSSPQVMSYVMALTRLRLLRAMSEAGFGHVAYVDTDGLIVDREGSERLAAADLPGLRVKSRWRRVEVIGPRQVVLDGKLRAAGIPRSAVRVGPDRWAGEVWQSLGAAARVGTVGAVVVAEREWRIRGRDRRRAHLPDGATAPYVID